MADLHKDHIAGTWKDASSSDTFDNRNPASTGDLIGRFPASSASDVDEAARSARSAFDIWRRTPAPQRGEILRRAGDLLTERKEKLARIMTREMGKPVFETEGDVQEAIDTAYYAASETRRLFGKTVPSELPDKFNMSVRRPVGVCGVITAWNFPVAVPSWKILPALASGNTVLFKPSEYSPHSGEVFVRTLLDAGIPDEVLQLVQGAGEVGQAMVEHPEVDLIAFTGSTETGSRIAAECGRRSKQVSLEMGGKNPMIVMSDADLDLALEGVVWGAFGTTGQRCTATSRLICHESVHDAFVDRIKEEAQNLTIGPGLNDDTEMGPLINRQALNEVTGYMQIGREDGATLAIGGEQASGDDLEDGYFFEPTIFTNVTPDMRIAQEEIFGPVLSVFKVGSYGEAVDFANDTRYGLSSSIYTNNVQHAFRAMQDLEAGITYVNGPTIGAEAHMPFGGVKDTGNGHREGGWTAFDIFTETKTVYVDFSGQLQKAQMDTHNE